MDAQSTHTHGDQRLLTDTEACDYLRIGSRQLLSWRRRGWIPFIHIGYAVRYRKRDLDAALDALTVGALAQATEKCQVNAGRPSLDFTQPTQTANSTHSSHSTHSTHSTLNPDQLQ
jgi:excisionase family DNA binding protein